MLTFASRHGAWLLALGLIVTAGCTAGGKPASTPSSPTSAPSPTPSAALVGWSNAMCGAAKQIDGVKDPANNPETADLAGSYVLEVASAVSSATRTLESTPSSGIAAADEHAARMLETLKRAWERLPDDTSSIMTASDENKLEKSRETAAVVKAIPSQESALAGLAKSVPALAVSYDLAPECTPVTRNSASDAAEPTRALVGWADAMCGIGKALEPLTADPLDDPLAKHPRFAPVLRLWLGDQVRSTAASLDSVEKELAAVSSVGAKAADDYQSSLLSSVKDARAELPETDPLAFHQISVDQAKKQVKRMVRVMKVLKPAAKDLRSAVAGQPALAASYDLAPRCAPPSAKPSATPPQTENGTDYAACRDGRCQIIVSKPVEIPVRGDKYLASVSGGTLTLAGDGGYMSVGPGGTAGFGQANGKTVRFRFISAPSPTSGVLHVSMS